MNKCSKYRLNTVHTFSCDRLVKLGYRHYLKVLLLNELFGELCQKSGAYVEMIVSKPIWFSLKQGWIIMNHSLCVREPK